MPEQKKKVAARKLEENYERHRMEKAKLANLDLVSLKPKGYRLKAEMLAKPCLLP